MAKTAAKVRKEGQEERGGGHAHIHASFNNTIITITDRQGNALSWRLPVAPASAARANPRRSPPRWLPEAAGKAAQECGVKNLEVRIKGPGPGANLRPRAERLA